MSTGGHVTDSQRDRRETWQRKPHATYCWQRSVLEVISSTSIGNDRTQILSEMTAFYCIYYTWNVISGFKGAIDTTVYLETTVRLHLRQYCLSQTLTCSTQGETPRWAVCFLVSEWIITQSFVLHEAFQLWTVDMIHLVLFTNTYKLTGHKHHHHHHHHHHHPVADPRGGGRGTGPCPPPNYQRFFF